MKVIFLDIDGVLNSSDWNEMHQDEIREGILVDKDKVRLLGQIVRNTGARIVLHSGWKFWYDAQMKPLNIEAKRLEQLLENEGTRIWGMTPDFTTEEIRKNRKFSLTKAKEILEWLHKHLEVDAWIVLDDLDLHNEQIAVRQIRTDPKMGLTEEEAMRAEKMLNAGLEFFEKKGRVKKTDH